MALLNRGTRAAVHLKGCCQPFKPWRFITSNLVVPLVRNRLYGSFADINPNASAAKAASSPRNTQQDDDCRSSDGTAAIRPDSNNIKVLKFGGSSVGSPKAFVGTAEVIRSHHSAGTHVVTVLSAVMGTTNLLLKSVEHATQRDMHTVNLIRSSVALKHADIAADLPLTTRTRRHLLRSFDDMMDTYFDKNIEALAAHGGVDGLAHEVNEVASLGERLSNLIMAGYLSDHNQPSQALQADDSLIRIHNLDKDGNGEPDLEATATNAQRVILPLIKDGVIPCVTGYFGSTADNKVATFGRGGSDLTAATLGHALSVEEVILSKVESKTHPSGYMHCWDPGYIGIVHHNDSNHTIRFLTYENAAELARFGRKVIHEHAVYPALAKKIPIRITNTLNYTDPGSLISPHRPSDTYSASPFEVTSTTIASTDVDSSIPANQEGHLGVIGIIGIPAPNMAKWTDRALDVLSRKNIHAEKTVDIECRHDTLVLLVADAERKKASLALHDDLIGHPHGMVRWLVPSSIPQQASGGMGWA